ncbi:flagellar biosynthesis protein FlhB [Photobacterium jeanii]|uniref:Flagellar biosynthesis protein FlhB n=1 Tax=Photobacterium jeanii TaxID=858640 RepID=A0A178KML5_9GAMM|nr:EscU/YscU/HrcU family type III secretion system export apparatus switch protein [Photobacterium jeanii]OAN18589.1 flagellar biosynthesis protein FlhB [Photobacterium jeanii]PST91730.1 flagellar biosynthesis protein FlhB [Photobacterium jeanii]
MNQEKSAIALHYDGYNTPSVTSKGYQGLAEHIIEQVKKQGGLVHQDPVLAEYLNELEVGDTIPEQVYLVIAELIAFSWVLNGKTPPGWEGLDKINVEV